MAEDLGRQHGPVKLGPRTALKNKTKSMSKQRRQHWWVTWDDIPEAAWKLALDRTKGLVGMRLGWDANLDNLVANAYLQGVTDVGANLELLKRIIDDATPRPDPAEFYAGA